MEYKRRFQHQPFSPSIPFRPFSTLNWVVVCVFGVLCCLKTSFILTAQEAFIPDAPYHSASPALSYRETSNLSTTPPDISEWNEHNTFSPPNFPSSEDSTRLVPPQSAVGSEVSMPSPPTFRHWVDDFETDTPTWVDTGSDCKYRLTLRLREKGAAMTGHGYEHLQIQCESEGSRIYMTYLLAPIEIRSELLVQLAVQANRSGLQLLGRVVLPHTLDPATQKAMSIYVTGGIYSSVNRWQRLRIENLSRQLQLEIAKRQHELGKKYVINPEGAYLDQLTLNTYSGIGTVDVFIDSLELNGVIPINPASVYLATTPANTYPNTYPNTPATSATIPTNIPLSTDNDVPKLRNFPSVDSPPSTMPDTPVLSAENATTLQTFTAKQFDIRLNRNVLTIDDTPIFVRAIRHRGESLEFLASLGFNTIWLEAPPTRLMEAEAALLNIWFICPPPVDLWKFQGNPTLAVQEEKCYGNLFNRVLAWNLGGTPTMHEMAQAGNGTPLLSPTGQEIKSPIDLARYQTALLRQIPSDILPNRPNLVLPNKDLTSFSTIYDIIMLDKNPLNSTLGMVSYGLWFREMLNLIRAQQTIFAKVPTQFDPYLHAQWRQIANTFQIPTDDPAYVPDALPLEQLRLLTYNVVMAGSRGILYDSTSRLDAQDEETQYRAHALELVNLEMLILEQWLSQGEKFTTLPSNHQGVAGALLATRHVRILLPMVIEPDSQYACGTGAERQIRFLVRGLPETYQCWQYSLNGLSPLVNRRTAGGVEVELEELPLVATIVMTQNPIITNSISKRILRYAPRLANRMKELAEIRLRSYLQFIGTEKLKENEAMWSNAKLYLDCAEKALYAHEYADAFILAQRAMRPITYLEKRLWQERVARFPSPNFLPTSVSFRTIKLQEKLLNATRNMRQGENLLPNGDFEDIKAVPQSGWKRFHKWNSFPGVTPRADIVPEAAHSGNNGLKLEVTSADRTIAPVMFDSPPIIMQSPGVFVGPPGTMYQVECWLKIPSRIINSVEGIKFTDSNSGEVLAERWVETNGWQKISFQRIVTNSNPVLLNISLTGYGTAYIDDVKIYPMK